MLYSLDTALVSNLLILTKIRFNFKVFFTVCIKIMDCVMSVNGNEIKKKLDNLLLLFVVRALRKIQSVKYLRRYGRNIAE
jgi:hypothetical protein